MNSYEEQVAEYLEEKGWRTINLSPDLFLFNKFDKDEKGLASALTEELGFAKVYCGVPDILAFKYVQGEEDWKYNILDYKFVEVKGRNDSLKLTQIKWMARYNDFDFEIAIVDAEDGIHFFQTDISRGEIL